MKQAALLLTIISLLFSSIACSKKQTKPPTQEATVAAEAFAVVEELRNAFVRKDAAALRLHATEDGLRDVMAAGGGFDTVAMQFTPRWVEIDGPRVVLNIAWQTSWTSGGRQADDRGMAVFILEGRPLKVAKIFRANPFLPPGK